MNNNKKLCACNETYLYLPYVTPFHVISWNINNPPMTAGDANFQQIFHQMLGRLPNMNSMSSKKRFAPYP